MAETNSGAGSLAPTATAQAVPSSALLTGYGIGSVGMGVWVTVPGLLLLYFLTNILGVNPALAGLALLVPKSIDVIVHPWFGTVSDRQRLRTGNRRRMMWIGLLLAAALVAVFSVPAGLSGPSAAAWVALFYIVGNLLFASFQVPYLTTPSDLDIDYNQRTRVMTFRMVVLTIGLLLAGVVAPAMVSSEERSSYSVMALALGSLMVISGSIAILAIKRMQSMMTPSSPDSWHPTLGEGLRMAWADRNFRWIVLSYLFTGTVTHLFLAGVPFYADYVLDNSKLTSVLVGAFLAPAIIASPIWLFVSKRIGKQRGLLISQAGFAIGSAALLAGSVLGVPVTLAIVFMLGVCFAGLQLMAFSMVPDVVRAASSDGSKAASYTGVWTATEATGTAIGPYVYSFVLFLGGFVASTAGTNVEQSSTALRALLLGFTLVPAAIMLVAMFFQRRYRDPGRGGYVSPGPMPTVAAGAIEEIVEPD